MPTPILTVPVDDAAFKRFLDTFKKYQDQLKEQPEMWKGMSDGVATVATAASIMTEEIIRQTEKTKALTDEEEKREKAAQIAARRRKKEEDDEDRREKKARDARKHQIDQVREYGRSVSNTISGFGKWAAVGNVGGLASGAIEGAAGLGALGVVGGVVGGLLAALAAGVGATYLAASSAGSSRRKALGYGTSMGRLQGYENQLQYDFDVDTVFGKMAAMQNDPAALSTFGMMGINPKGKDTADLVKESALAARRMWIADQKNPMLAQAHGYGNVFSIPDLNTLAANSPAELAKKFAAGDMFAKKSGLTDDQGKKAQELVVAMGNLTDKIKNGMIATLTKLDPILTRVVNDFSKLADDLEYILSLIPSAPSGKTIGNAALGAGMGFITGGPVGAILGGISGGMGPAPGSKGALFPNSLTGGKSYKGFNPWASSGSGKGDASGADDVYSYFRQKGWSDSAAQGIAAGIFAESGSKHDRFNEGGSGAYGLAQWLTKSRLTDFKNTYGHDIYHSTRAEQLAFIDKELRSTESFAGSQIGNAQTAYEALQAFIHHYERPGAGTHGDLKRGKRYLDRHVKIKVSNQTGANVATTVNSAAS